MAKTLKKHTIRLRCDKCNAALFEGYLATEFTLKGHSITICNGDGSHLLKPRVLEENEATPILEFVYPDEKSLTEQMDDLIAKVSGVDTTLDVKWAGAEPAATGTSDSENTK